MAAGDFLDIYNDLDYLNSQDCVTTCFFMDCAHNILDFIQTIYKVIYNLLDYIDYDYLDFLDQLFILLTLANSFYSIAFIVCIGVETWRLLD